MRLSPHSLFGRLLGLSILTSCAALAFAAVGIGHVLERFVIHGLDEQLDAEARMLARAVRRDGTLDRARVVNLPAFDGSGDGWGWRVESSAGQWCSGDVGAVGPLTVAPPPGPPSDRNARERFGPRPGDDTAPSGERVHFRQFSVPTGNGPALVTVAGPRRVAVAPLREAMIPLAGSLAVLAGALAIAIALQLRVGLRPLRALGIAVADVRAGRAGHVSSDQPAELEPLVSELNALLDQNRAQLESARHHVANLAHGLKTPLAALSVKVAESGRDPDGSLGAIVAEMDGRVRHHLGRARAVAPGGGVRARTSPASAVADLVAVMQGIHAAHPVTVSTAVAPDLMLRVDRQDLIEMLGNLIDNAWRHARSSVAITASAIGANIELAIEDDGPGLSADAAREALVPGRRLDERGDGHGFGLPIARELAELNGGSLLLERSAALGGLRACLCLPATLGA